MKNETYRILMTVGLYLAIAVLLLTLIVIVKNVNEIKSDPIVYGINKNLYQSCSCHTSEGKYLMYDSEGFVMVNEFENFLSEFPK